jgi:1-acyl-sn-glycerol-3-phosphate acyltransferase
VAEIVYPPVVKLCRAMFRLLDLRLEVIGSEHVPQTDGAVLASNHVGYLDFIFAGLGTQEANRLVRFMAKDAVFRHKIAGPLMRGMHHIPVDRSAGAGSYVDAVQALRDGEIVGVFPEATISRSFELKEFKTGAVRMARDAEVPVLPLVLWGTQRLLTKGRSPKGMKRRHLPITIVIGEPFSVAPDAEPMAATAELKSRMQGLLDVAQDRYPGRPFPGEEPWWLPVRLGGTAPTPQEAAAQDAAARQQNRPSHEPGAQPPA